MWWRVFPTPSRFATPAGVLQFGSVLNIPADSIRSYSRPTRLPPFISVAHHKSRLSLCFWQAGCKSEVPVTPSLGSINLLEQPSELRKQVYSLVYGSIPKDSKGYEWMARLLGRLRPRGVPSTEALSLWSAGVTPSACGCVLVHQPGSSRDSLVQGFI